MVNLVNKLADANKEHRHSHEQGGSYSTYQEPDTSVPPKARPVFNQVSVDGVVIEEQAILVEAQNHPAENPGEALMAAARALAVRQLLLARAEELGLTAEPGKDGEGRTETKEDALIRVLIEEEISAPQATDDECRRYYDLNRQKFRSEPLWEACHILVAADPTDEKARAEARVKAEALISHLDRKPDEFAALAAEFSDCPSGQQGGNLGQLSQGSTVSEFEAMLNRLDAGETVTSPVESRFGFHIIRLDRRIDGEQLPYEIVRDRIAAWLEAAAWSKSVSQYIALLAADAVVTGVELFASDGPLVQ